MVSPSRVYRIVAEFYILHFYLRQRTGSPSTTDTSRYKWLLQEKWLRESKCNGPDKA